MKTFGSNFYVQEKDVVVEGSFPCYRPESYSTSGDVGIRGSRKKIVLGEKIKNLVETGCEVFLLQKSLRKYKTEDKTEENGQEYST